MYSSKSTEIHLHAFVMNSDFLINYLSVPAFILLIRLRE